MTGTKKCASIFVGVPPSIQEGHYSDVHVTFARHSLVGCFEYDNLGNIKAEFKVEDCFDFSRNACIPPGFGVFGSLSPIGCIPQLWWVEMAENNIWGGSFEQKILWRETITTPFDTSNTLPIVSNPSCQNDVGFCPFITQLDPNQALVLSNQCPGGVFS